MEKKAQTLIYLLRRDLRVADNPILHHLASTPNHGFTHLLPVYVFPSHQIEVSGFLKDGAVSPYPKALSPVGKFWRCGPLRAKFLAESVWDLKNSLENLQSGLAIRVGKTEDVVDHLLRHLRGSNAEVGAVWMTEEKSYEEVQEQQAIEAACSNHSVDFKLWQDEKYFIDDRDTGLEKPKDLPDIFTSYRKSQEPLRARPRATLKRPDRGSLPSMPDPSLIPAQADPFVMPDTLDDAIDRLVKPVQNFLSDPPPLPEVESAHPFQGGESRAHNRLTYLIKSGNMTNYKDTRDGLLGPDYSTKLSGYLAHGCITARWIHAEMLKFEDGTEPAYASGEGYGQGENKGTTAVRFELLWRDYMRLCTMKFGRKLFSLHGFGQIKKYTKQWKTADKTVADPYQDPSPDEIAEKIQRFLNGSTGLGLIDASQRELYHTGYTSNRARQNVASFFAKHLEIDWRYGAEWYEMMLVDHDVSSNWSNWQYVAGVGNDPRGEARIFNPVKQAFDYDKDGAYVRGWVPEIKGIRQLEHVFQASTADSEELEALGLINIPLVADPIKRIPFTVEQRPRGGRKSFAHRRGQGRGGRRGGGGGGNGANGGNGNAAFPGNNGGGGGGNGGNKAAAQWRGNGHTNGDGNETGPGGSGGNSSSEGQTIRAMNGRNPPVWQPSPVRRSRLSYPQPPRRDFGPPGSGHVLPPSDFPPLPGPQGPVWVRQEHNGGGPWYGNQGNRGGHGNYGGNPRMRGRGGYHHQPPTNPGYSNNMQQHNGADPAAHGQHGGGQVAPGPGGTQIGAFGPVYVFSPNGFTTMQSFFPHPPPPPPPGDYGPPPDGWPEGWR
ncbi:DNA photolyase, FAD-binding/Cryptochrome [Stachybotrys elegans]|uniref:DNA photolyase, FAD-binding/Cryptochrome n=1 Tax=Stachybotrys elegans TaxID=80388 RepID=A0A8K0WKR0_9HYPO|nr:DNA photolyase, FAD-binding/Cryptochrome [Stachybotrys elegans]